MPVEIANYVNILPASQRFGAQRRTGDAPITTQVRVLPKEEVPRPRDEARQAIDPQRRRQPASSEGPSLHSQVFAREALGFTGLRENLTTGSRGGSGTPADPDQEEFEFVAEVDRSRTRRPLTGSAGLAEQVKERYGVAVASNGSDRPFLLAYA